MSLAPEPADRREEIRVRKDRDVEQSERIVVDEVAERRLWLYRISQFLWLACGALEALIGLRVVLKFIAANPNAGFARMVYSLSALFLQPFAGLVINPSFEGIVLEVTSLIAMMVYALLTLLVVQAIWILFYRTYTRSLKTYRRTS